MLCPALVPLPGLLPSWPVAAHVPHSLSPCPALWWVVLLLSWGGPAPLCPGMAAVAMSGDPQTWLAQMLRLRAEQLVAAHLQLTCPWLCPSHSAFHLYQPCLHCLPSSCSHLHDIRAYCLCDLSTRRAVERTNLLFKLVLTVTLLTLCFCLLPRGTCWGNRHRRWRACGAVWSDFGEKALGAEPWGIGTFTRRERERKSTEQDEETPTREVSEFRTEKRGSGSTTLVALHLLGDHAIV